MLSNLKEMRNDSVAEDGQKGLGGGVREYYGEDSATEDQLITPSTFQLPGEAAAGYDFCVLLFLYATVFSSL
ncbi:hypothetical protein QN277_000684 [Acacia crassicarpa]|uniref:Uncharacterized protein n=1 Tax=Acacia crassicarpa TaxID=499986 RepID=A0AAE1N5V6_9FABA|nr:hypothetical protein QN277_000684 [Acacia crassicarpa]